MRRDLIWRIAQVLALVLLWVALVRRGPAFVWDGCDQCYRDWPAWVCDWLYGCALLP